MAASFKGLQAANRRKTIALLVGMFFLTGVVVAGLVYLSGAVSAAFIVPIAVGIAIVATWGAYFSSDKLVLKMTGAKVVSHDEAPQLYNIVEELCIASGLPLPKVAIVSDPAPNAFATGRNPEHAVVAFTTGLLEVMDREQLQAVAAHELAHVANRDTLVSAVAATTAGLLAIASDIGIRAAFFRRSESANPIMLIISLLILLAAPIAALLLKAAVSRSRESLADATAVAYTRNPAGMRRALEELAADSTVVQAKSNAVAHVWIESPLDGAGMSKWFSTHPPITSRIEALRQMEATGPIS